MFTDISADNVLEYLDRILSAQIIDLKHTSIVAPKALMLVTIGCMNSIEYLGGIDNGLLGEKNKAGNRFKNGIRLLNGENMDNPSYENQLMWDLRNGMTHQYIPSLEHIQIRHIKITSLWTDNQAIVIEGENLTLNVAQLIKDIDITWHKLEKSLETDQNKRSRLAKILDSFPILC